MKKTDIEERTKELLAPILEEGDYLLWDVAYEKEGQDMYLRVYVDKKDGGITIDDCVLISRALEKKLDEEDFIAEAYILEVSSPGLTRPLKKTADFVRCVGKLAELKLFQPAEGVKELTAMLVSADEEQIVVQIQDTPGAEEKKLTIARNNIAKARLAFVDSDQ